MREHMELRVLQTAEYILETKTTVREAAKRFHVSKSTVHKDMGERLLELEPSLYADVRKVLEQNKAERHLRGGLATREKYKVVAKIKDIRPKRDRGENIACPAPPRARASRLKAQSQSLYHNCEKPARCGIYGSRAGKPSEESSPPKLPSM